MTDKCIKAEPETEMGGDYLTPESSIFTYELSIQLGPINSPNFVHPVFTLMEEQAALTTTAAKQKLVQWKLVSYFTWNTNE